MKNNTPRPAKWQDRSVVSDAYEVHSGMLWLEVQRPKLRTNPQWIIAKQDAYETFHEAFIKACTS